MSHTMESIPRTKRLLCVMLLVLSACGDGGIITPKGDPATVAFAEPVVSMTVGQSRLLTVVVNGGSPPATLSSCTSSDPTVATVATGSGGCAVTAVRIGTVTVTANALSGKVITSATAALTIAQPPVSISIDPTAVSLSVGASADVAVRISGGVSPSLQSCASSNSTIMTAAVLGANSCRVTALAPGVATLTARASTGEVATGSVSVLEATIARVVLAPAVDTLRTRGLRQFSASLQDGVGRTVAGRVGLRWVSSNPTIVTVDSTGLATALAPGAATITASIPANTGSPVFVSGTAQLVVLSPVRSLTVSPSTSRLQRGLSLTITPTLSVDAGASTGIIWRSNAPAIATVSAAPNGSATVTGVAAGAAEIVAIAQADTTVRVSIPLTVFNGVTSVTVDPAAASVLVSRTIGLAVFVRTEPGVSFAVRWASSNTAVATVNAFGEVTGITPGIATIRAIAIADSTVFGAATVTVTSGVRSITVSPQRDSVFPGKTRTLTANVVTEAGVSSGVVWASRLPGIATVSSTGVVQGVSPGTAVIVASASRDARITDSAILTVADPCEFRIVNFVGTTVNGTIDSSSCFNGTEYTAYGRFVATSQLVTRFGFTSTMPSSYIPLISSRGWWFRSGRTNESGCLMVPPGTWDFAVQSAQSGSFGFSTSAAGSVTGCSWVVAMTGATGSVSINANSPTYFLNGTTNSRFGYEILLLPPLLAGESITLTATGGLAFEPILELYTDSYTFLRSAGGVGQRNAEITYTSTSSGSSFLIARVLGRAALQTGTLTFSVTGPSGSIRTSALRANANVPAAVGKLAPPL